ncbi:MAG: hypothetical protein EOP31_17860 [Rhodococcus sp. (in: high G+C Gram-positive bacteria)]|uniref:putative Ig domain-containing protein n=1 Tax=Rhodococcus sp. TaxID=1831 RepID=UPI0011F7B719|nr:putative Ig domain-containing protein [Rhodococcus sp. (in: high G+C Gram-positive bacteria)]RZL23516.1 MAG: hypothetical protein EOP31_17860 [Rhodococcus sp. (in: high G+C Gram-positive bacteria)]
MPTGLTFGACTSAGAAVSPGDVFPVRPTAVTCTAGNSWGLGSGTFTVTVTPYLEAPSFINPPAGPLTAVAGTPFTHTLTVAGTPDLVLTATDLPDWLDFSPTGALTGTPPAAGSFPFTITADNEIGTPATLQVTVTVAAAPVIDPPATGSLGSLNSIFGFGS